MIAIEHYSSHIQVNSNGEGAWYHTGLTEPTYPMPAILYGVDWFHSTDTSPIDSIVVFRHYTDDEYELPEIVAKF